MPDNTKDYKVRVDSSDVDELYKKLVEADEVLKAMQEDALKIASSLSGVNFGSFQGMQSAFASSGGIQALVGIQSKLDATISQLSARIDQLINSQAQAATQATQAVQQPSVNQPQSFGATGGSQGAGGQAPATNLLFNQWLQQQMAHSASQQQQAYGPPGAGQWGPTNQAPAATPAYGGGNWNQNLTNQATQSGILNTLMPYTTGGTAPLYGSGSSMTQGAIAPGGGANTVGGSAIGGSYGGGGGGSSSASNYTPGSKFGGGWLQTSLNLMHAGNTETEVVNTTENLGKSALKSIVGTIAKSNPIIAGIVGGGAAAVTGAAIVNNLAATQLTREQSLFANVGGLADQYQQPMEGAVGSATHKVNQDVLGNLIHGHIDGSTGLAGGVGAMGSNTLMQQILKSGNDFNLHPADSTAIASDLGGRGMRKEDIAANTRESMALSAITGESTSQTDALTSTLSVQGGRSPGQIDKIFQNMWLSSEKAGISMTKMVDSIQTLEQATNGAARSNFDISGAMAVQKLVGTNANTGTMFAPAQKAAGFEAIGTAGMLGISLQHFQNIQGNQASLFDATASRVQGLFGGGKRVGDPTATQISLTEGFMKSAGIADLSSMSVENQAKAARLFLNAKPDEAQNLARDMAKLQGPVSFDKQGQAVSNATTSQVTQFQIDAETKLAQNAVSAAEAIAKAKDATLAFAAQALKAAQDLVKLDTIGTKSGNSWDRQNIPGVAGIEDAYQKYLDLFKNPGATLGGLGTAIGNAAAGAGSALSGLAAGAGNVGGTIGSVVGSGFSATAGAAQGLGGALGGLFGSGTAHASAATLPSNDKQWDAYVGSNGATPDNTWTAKQKTAYTSAADRLGVGKGGSLSVEAAGRHPLSANLAKQYYAAGYKYGVNPLYMMAQGAKESGFDPQAASADGGQGIGQFENINIDQAIKDDSPIHGFTKNIDKSGSYKPGTFNPYNVTQAIDLQTWEFQQSLVKYKGDPTKALAAYNAGAGGEAQGLGFDYAKAIESSAATIQKVQVEVNGKTQITDLTGAMIGFGTFVPAKPTIDPNRKPQGHRVTTPPAPTKPKKHM